MSSNEKGAAATAPEPEDRDGLDESTPMIPHQTGDGNKMLLAALALAARGFYVFPVFGDSNDPRDKSPVGKKCKAPIGVLVPHGVSDATTNPEVIRRWWTAEPNANIGIACGPSKLCIGDVDSAAGELAVKHSGAFPATLEARTGKGRHAYMRGESTSVNRVLEGVDRKSKGGYVVAPPSVHESGRVYEWINPDTEIADAPQWFRKAGRKKKAEPIKPGVDASGNLLQEATRKRFHGRGGADADTAWKALTQLASWRADDYTAWVDVGMACKAAGLDCFDWEQWSRQSVKFQEGLCAKKWATFKGDGLSVGSLVHWAREDSGLVVSTATRVEVIEPGRPPIPDGGPVSVALEFKREAGKARTTVIARSGDKVLGADTVNLFDAKARGKLAAMLAGNGAGDVVALERMLLDRAAEPASEEPLSDEPSRESLLAEKDAETTELLARMPQDIRREAESVLRGGKVLERIRSDTELIGIAGEVGLRTICYVIGTSRLLVKPLGGLIQGLSSSGKSYVPRKVSDLFPAETILLAHEVSPNALYYAKVGRLVHTWVLGGERKRSDKPEQQDATKALREMLAEGELRKLVTITDSGRPESIEIYQPGPIAYTESTTAAKVFDEDSNRLISLASDESDEQVERIIQSQARRSEGLADDSTHIIQVHHAMQRMLRRLRVKIPYASELAACIPRRPETNRAFPMLLSGIEAVALLRQYERLTTPQHGDEVCATIEDYAVAAYLLRGPLGRALGNGLTPAVVRFGQALRARFGDEDFEPADAAAAQKSVKASQKVNDYLRALADAGCALRVEKSHGNVAAKWKMLTEVGEHAATWLPDPKGLQ
ncbi:MAG: bifunctional DNA primase/polymerase [Planctomycetes bacterium]|nr:bifunctional DNA primase/polymerase [Planctomycetota bacterium]